MLGSYDNPIIVPGNDYFNRFAINFSSRGATVNLSTQKMVYVSDSDGVFEDISCTHTLLTTQWSNVSTNNFKNIMDKRNDSYGYLELAFIKNNLYTEEFIDMLIPGTSTLNTSDLSYFPSDTTLTALNNKSTQFKLKMPPHSNGWFTIAVHGTYNHVFLIDSSVPSPATLTSCVLQDLNAVPGTLIPSDPIIIQGTVHNLGVGTTLRFQAVDDNGAPVPFTPFALYINGMNNPKYYVTDDNGISYILVDYNVAYANRYVPFVIFDYTSRELLAQCSIPWFAGGVLPTFANTLRMTSESNSKLVSTFYTGTAATLNVTGGIVGKSFIIKNVTDKVTLWNGVFDSAGKATVYITYNPSTTNGDYTCNYSVESVGNSATLSITWLNRNNGKFYVRSKNGYSFSNTSSDLSNIKLTAKFENQFGASFYAMVLTFHLVNNTTGGAIIGADDANFATFTVGMSYGSKDFELPPAWRQRFVDYPGTYNIVATAVYNFLPMPWMFVIEKPIVILPPLDKSSIVSAATNATTPLVMTSVNVSSLFTSQSETVAKYVNVANATVVVPAINTTSTPNRYTGFVDDIPFGGVLYIPSNPGDTFIIQYKQYTTTYNHLQDGSDNITVVDPTGKSQNFNPVPVGGSYYIGLQRFVRILGGSSGYAPDYDVVCFLSDAPVLTPSGYKEIGSLKVGDLVMTADGSSSPITKVKVQHVNPCSETNPYIIRKGQFGATRRLLISPNHKVLVAGCGLVEARNLGLEQKSMAKSFDYYNLELESSKNMIVAGVVVESLAPKRRFILSAEEFRTLVLRNFGRMTPEVQERVRAVSRVLADGRVEFIATAQR